MKLLRLLILSMVLVSPAWADVVIQDNGGSNKMAVDANSSAKVTGPTTASQSGFIGLTGISGAGATASNKRFNPIYGSEGGGQRQAVPVVHFDYTFNATSQNTAIWQFGSTTQTGAQTAGYLILNSSSVTTINTNSAVKSWRSFPLFAKAELRVTFAALHTVTPQTNAVTEWGLMNATIPGAAAPTDGCFFRFNASAEFRGICSFNGTETTTPALSVPSANVNHDYTIVIQTNTVVFYVDDLVVGTITLLTDAAGQGQPMLTASNPITIRHINTGSAPSLAMQFKVSDVFVTSLGPDLVRPWAHQKSGMAMLLSQGQDGGTMGSTALYTNSLAPGAGAAMTNTTAALTAGLGGQFSAQPTLAANTDGIVQSYQNPAGGVNQTPRTMYITGVTIQSMVTTALTSLGPVLYAYSLAYGHSAVSMATAELASFTSGTTKAPRRIALGYETFINNASVGTLGQGVTMRFDTPIPINPSEFIALCAKNVGTVTTAGVITFLVTYDGYME